MKRFWHLFAAAILALLTTQPAFSQTIDYQSIARGEVYSECGQPCGYGTAFGTWEQKRVNSFVGPGPWMSGSLDMVAGTMSMRSNVPVGVGIGEISIGLAMYDHYTASNVGDLSDHRLVQVYADVTYRIHAELNPGSYAQGNWGIANRTASSYLQNILETDDGGRFGDHSGTASWYITTVELGTPWLFWMEMGTPSLFLPGSSLDASTSVTFHVVGAPGIQLGIASAGGYNPVAAIPEPETYPMLLAGLGLLGWHARRRKQKLAA